MSPATSTKAKAAERDRRARGEAAAQGRQGPGVFAPDEAGLPDDPREPAEHPVVVVLLRSRCAPGVLLLIGVALGNSITWFLIGIPFAVLAAVILLSRHAENAPRSPDRGSARCRRCRPVHAQAPAGSWRARPWMPSPRTCCSAPWAARRRLRHEGPVEPRGQLGQKERRRVGPVITDVPIHVIKSGGTGRPGAPEQAHQQLRRLGEQASPAGGPGHLTR
ncbi:DUF4191 domain-containing protein [Kocuria rhizophila]|nr:DUF4191 domain-containing protein [Kocuria rhizophila]